MWQNVWNWIAGVAAALGAGQPLAMVKSAGARTGQGIMPGGGVAGAKGVLASQGLTQQDWIESGYWAVVISSNVTAIRYGEPDLKQTKSIYEEQLLQQQLGSSFVPPREQLPKSSPLRHATLYVAFATKHFGSTRIYKYFGVERHLAENMFLAPSIGTFVWDRLRGGSRKSKRPGATSRYAYAGPFTASNV